MWFVNFVLFAAMLVTSLVVGLSTYLERAVSTAKVIEAVPLPLPKPKLAVQRRPQGAEELEFVMVPKPTQVSHKRGAQHPERAQNQHLVGARRCEKSAGATPQGNESRLTG
jgi:hypothetical protein